SQADRDRSVELLRLRRHQRLAAVPSVQRLMLSWVNGVPGEQSSVRDRGLAYGDGLFETIAVRGGHIPLLARHMARLADGCRRLSIPLDLLLMERELQAFAGQLGEGVAKLIVTRGEGQRGCAPPQACQAL